jgi:putative addiction module CopG family antidote
VTLGEYFEAFIAVQIKGNRVSSVSEVICAGLRLLKERDIRLVALQQAMEEGEDSSTAEYSFYVVPITSDSEHYPPDGQLRVYRSRTGGHAWEALTQGLPSRDCYVNVLRDAMAVDTLEPCGVYVGTTGGQVYASADAGDHWAPIVRDLPAVVSVEVQVLP